MSADRSATSGAAIPELIEPALGASEPDSVEAKPRRKLLFWASLAWLLIVVFAAITASWLPISGPNTLSVGDGLASPGQDGYVLGADRLGRDMLSRLIHGSRVSIVVSISAVAIAMVVGGLLGVAAGFFRGRFERTVISATDVALAFPALVLLLGLLAFVGRSLLVLAVTIGILFVPRYIRIARAATLAVAQREFVLAAMSIGARRGRIMIREVIPNVLMSVLAFALLSLGVVIVLEGSLSFLGLSVAQPTPTWGGMIAEGKRDLEVAPHVAAVPSVVMFLTVVAVNFVGDHLRSRYFDVRQAAL